MTKFVLIVVSMLVILNSCTSKVDNGSVAPDFSLKTVDGHDVRLSDRRGKLVLLHFWADYCSECRAEFPRMQKAYAQLHGQNFELIAVNTGQSRLHVEDFKEEFGISFPMLVDEVAAVAKRYQVHALPTNFIISPEGEVRDVLVGWVSEEYLQRAVTQAENEKNKVVQR
jgi:peroxiredoxin